ncbi:MAG: hypothetical protein ACSHX0_13335 [Akkermansiaceae bacterium]
MQSKTTNIFSIPQKLTLPLGNLKVLSTELIKQNFGEFKLIVIAEGEGTIINTLWEQPILQDQPVLDALMDGDEVSVTLAAFEKHNFKLSGVNHEIIFSCGRITGKNNKGKTYQFFIPHIHFGKGDESICKKYGNGGMTLKHDRISFNVDGVLWTLKHLYEIDGLFYDAREGFELLESKSIELTNLVEAGHAVLEVPSEANDEKIARKTAENICWLLHLALGQTVAWSQMRIINGSKSHFICNSNFSLPSERQQTPPIRNWADFRLKSYLEIAYPVFIKDSDWWQLTLNWYSLARTKPAIESSLMIYYMLLERLSTFILKDRNFSKQIGQDLADYLADDNQRVSLQNSITELMKSCTKCWDKYRSKSLVDQVERWNDGLSYPKQIETSFELSGVIAPPKFLLSNRHKLMHQGSLAIKDQDKVLAAYGELNLQVLVLLFSMLNYEGKFFSQSQQNEADMYNYLLPSE